MIHFTSFTHEGHAYQIRAAQKSDLLKLTDLFNGAFSMWKNIGIAKRTPEEIERYSFEDCQVVIDSDSGEMTASFCVREAQPKIVNGEILVERSHKTDSAKLLDEERVKSTILGKRFLYLYGLTVDPRLAKQGLGLAIGKVIYVSAMAEGYNGFMLETGKDTGWLVEWYKRIGFEVIGEGLSKTGTRTVMMVRVF